ncbi:MAG: hypothetical protein A2289_10105 [Deltaproteobacteria bacterium RIFOXYA12_FULL_58_15]|nr:MAG: hypothetical protein A2289_10105 [Deltaproteobacteria bacterium RIFOXYA12_FULL_58_15]OGR08178.1 MAG: hypothetical protein A2341_20150 [Deltaproteobacteria bacterium RIFOXYB12_FULL_58_9]
MRADGYQQHYVAMLAVTLMIGCGEVHRVRVIDRIERSGRFTTVDKPLPTLDSIDHVRGSVVEMFGGASIRIDSANPARDRGVNRDQLVSHPESVQTSWVKDGEVAVPTDIASLLLLSAYAHFERAAVYFSELDSIVTENSAPCFYDPHIPISDDLTVSTVDNAAYVPIADLFLIMRTEKLGDIPLALNPGVLAHEYAHRVFYYELWGAELADVEMDPLAANLLGAVDEGVADYFAARIVNDPQFTSHSLDETAAAARDLSTPRQLEVAWLDGTKPTKSGVYDPYPLGTVLAANLWHLVDAIADLDTAVLAAQRSVRIDLSTHGFTYQVGDFEIALLQHLDESTRIYACAELEYTYAAAWNRFSGVCL